MVKGPVYTLEINDQGVFLSVNPQSEVHLSLSLIKQEIAAREIEEVDWNDVQRAHLKRPEKTKIAPQQNALNNDGVLVIEISDDQMEAYATLFPPLDDGRPVKKGDVIEKLSKAGVNYGVDQERIEELATFQQHAVSWVIARGKEAEKGKEAVIEYSFNTSKDLSKPQVLDDGRVDFYNLNLIQNTVEGQELARKIPAVSGVSGFTVTGKEIKPPHARDIPLKAGKNTMLENDGLTLVAKISGHVALQGGRVCVFPVYVVDGDVDLSTGNIDFIGGVRILGSVKPGFAVNAGQDVEVNRTIEGGFIKAGGNITVKEGILGHGGGQIIAGGSISARYLENANIEAGEDIIVGESIMHSIVKAGNTITVKGQKGKIIGGLCFAGKEIEAKVIGSALAVNTELEIGISSQTIADLKALYENELGLKDQLQKLEQVINVLNNAKESEKCLVLKGRDPDSLITTQQDLLLKLEETRIKRAGIMANCNKPEHGRVRVQDYIYPDVVIRFGHLSYYVREKMRHTCFYKQGDDVKVMPY